MRNPFARRLASLFNRHGLAGTLLLSLVCLTTSGLSAAEEWVVYEGDSGVGKGKHIVFIGGDEEYRSEEALPMLARILAFHHGFKCTVLFPVDEDTGLINPNNQTRIPGTQAVEDADLLVMSLRFRELPDDAMKPIVDFAESGKPIIGLRTSTHAFNYSRNPQSPYATWSFNSNKWKGGFGQQVLGDTWISHHGHHGSESTRGIIVEENADHPILIGVKGVWGPTDVYGIRNLPDDATVLLKGEVVAGMKPTDPAVDGPKNDPMMPVAWTLMHDWGNGNTSRIVCTTMGASVDLENPGLRRTVINSCLWAMGMEKSIEPDLNIEYVGDYEPTMFGFKSDEYWKDQGMKPADFVWPKE